MIDYLRCLAHLAIDSIDGPLLHHYKILQNGVAMTMPYYTHPCSLQKGVVELTTQQLLV